MEQYIVYITINLCNGKFYIGVHKTNPEVFDGYIGLGVYRQNQATGDYPFHRAIRKYGYENFKRTTLRIFPNTEQGRDDAFALEGELVTPTVLKSKNCYNVQVGGYGGTGFTAKTVYQFSLNGVFMRKWDSCKSAERTLGISHIDSVCRGERDSAGGYYWSYEKKFAYSPYNNAKRIAQYTVSGKFIRTWNSCKEAERELGLFNIHRVLSIKALCGHYQWREYTGDNSDISPLMGKDGLRDMYQNEINQFDKEGNLIKTWKNIDELDFAGFNKRYVRAVIKGRQKTYQGYIFKMKDSDIVLSSNENRSSNEDNSSKEDVD